MGIFSDNPVLWREVRGRLRLRRSSRGGIWTARIVGLVILYAYVRGLIAIGRGTAPDARDFWSALTYLLLVLIVVLAPALAATAITQEREQQTWETLATTRLTAAQVIVGKWVARQFLPALSLVIALPLYLGCSVRGEIAFSSTFAVLLFLLLTMALFSILGLFCSFRAGRTTAATASALTLSIFLCLGTLILDGLLRAFHLFGMGGGPYGGWGYGTETPVLWLNPFSALGALISEFGVMRDHLSASPYDAAAGGLVTGYALMSLLLIAVCLSAMIRRYNRAL